MWPRSYGSRPCGSPPCPLRRQRQQPFGVLREVHLPLLRRRLSRGLYDERREDVEAEAAEDAVLDGPEGTVQVAVGAVGVVQARRGARGRAHQGAFALQG